MSKHNLNDDLVRIVTDVSKECRKKLRILAIQTDTTLALAVRDVLEREMSKKKTLSIKDNIE